MMGLFLEIVLTQKSSLFPNLVHNLGSNFKTFIYIFFLYLVTLVTTFELEVDYIHSWNYSWN